MPRYHDVDGRIVTTDETIQGLKTNAPKDGSQRFNLVGGPLHGMHVRVYAPFDEVVFRKQLQYKNDMWYNLRPPLKDGGPWTYVYDAVRSESEVTTQEGITNE